MLLNKYAAFNAIAKDDYAEELLFKIEKNVGLKATLEQKCFAHLHAFVQTFKTEPLSVALKVDFSPLLKYAGKFQTLADNIEHIWRVLAKHLNARVKDERSLRECFQLCSQIGKLVAVLARDLRGKARLIQHDIPRVVFTTQQRDQSFVSVSEAIDEEQRCLALDWVLDLWTYREPLTKLS